MLVPPEVSSIAADIESSPKAEEFINISDIDLEVGQAKVERRNRPRELAVSEPICQKLTNPNDHPEDPNLSPKNS